MQQLRISDVVSLLRESVVSTRPALDQRKQNRRGSVEKYERTSSKLATSLQFVNKNSYQQCKHRKDEHLLEIFAFSVESFEESGDGSDLLISGSLAEFVVEHQAYGFFERLNSAVMIVWCCL